MKNKNSDMTIGITGTRSGMSESQKTQFISLLNELNPSALIDGCCLGVDEEAYLIAKERGIHTIGMPGHSAKNPLDMTFRSIFQRDDMHSSDTHFSRNRKIVDTCDVMIAMPYALNGKGGTNYTIDYAKKQNKTLYVLLRDIGFEY